MNLVDLYNLTLVVDAIRSGEKVSTKDINFAYSLIPNDGKLKTRKAKIRELEQHFDKISEDALKKILMERAKFWQEKDKREDEEKNGKE